MDNQSLRLAVQKSGRLYEDSIKLIESCGISINRADNKLKSRANNFPLELLYLRDDDIPEYVADGVAHAGIVGKNLVVEKQKLVSEVVELGFGRCRLSIAGPESLNYTDIQSLQGKRIATTYKNTLSAFLEKEGLNCEIREIRGSAEIAPGIGLADAVCDLVSSGSTLLSNRLKELTTVLHSEAVLIKNRALNSEVEALLGKLIFRIRAVRRASNSKYILLNAPTESVPAICEILPGLKSPTVLPLARSGWSSVHSVVSEDDFWEVIEGVGELGAEGVLIVPIEKMVGIR